MFEFMKMNRLLCISIMVGISSCIDVSAQQCYFVPVKCDGHYKGHLQGICTNEKNSIYWSFTVTLVKTDVNGRILKKINVKTHHGDLCHHEGKILCAVNFGRFNDVKGNADNWVYVYDADNLTLLAKHKVPEVKHGAGGIAVANGRFFVVGGLPKGVNENYAYEYDGEFNFKKKHVIKSGYTLLGIQTATFFDDRFWFGCYGNKLVVADAFLKFRGKYDFDCSLGIVGIGRGKALIGRGKRVDNKGYVGSVTVAQTHKKNGLVIKANDKKDTR